MSIELNHTIVHVPDRDAGAREVASLLGLEEPTRYGPFAVVELANGVTLDFMTDDGEIAVQHYAFLVGEEEFTAIHGRIVERGQTFWADPFRQSPYEINTNDGGRGLYWEGPGGHNLEIITVPYGGA
ncbi:MAG: VOC family protein [Nocardioidaceae bacterium]|nr:VOC family protein [Nocardioidaceae bacterium]